MNSDPYSEKVRALFGDPAHAGVIEDAVSVEIEDQGVRIALFAVVTATTLERLGFLAWGCPHLIAAAEGFCRDFEGKQPADLLEFSSADLMQSLSVPVEKTGRILVLEDAARSLGKVAGETLKDQED